jgi:hypothetical protein
MTNNAKNLVSDEMVDAYVSAVNAHLGAMTNAEWEHDRRNKHEHLKRVARIGLTAALTEYIKSLPADWHADSSLETWFPLTSEELTRLRQENQTLRFPRASKPMLAQAGGAVSERQLSPQDDAMGAWLSAALSDSSVCDEMKRDIHNWMDQFQWSSSLDNCQMSKPHDDGKVAMDVTWEKE